MVRARRAVLAVAAMLAVLVVAGSATPAAAATAPPKALVLSATPTTTVWSQPTKLSVSLTPKGGGTPKGGTLTFISGDQVLGTAVATKRMTTFSTAALPVGTHDVVATYSGDGATRAATSAPVTITVDPAPTSTALSATTSPVAPGERAELKAVVRPKAPARTSDRPGGTVTFTTGESSATVRVNANGVATWRPLLPEGSHEVTATYGGSATFAAGSGASTTVEIGEQAPDTRDQINPAGQGVTLGLDGGQSGGTTFTAGRTGDLDRVDLDHRSGTGSFTLTIRTLSGGVPSSTVLGSASGAFGATGTLSIELDQPVPVQAGTQYALVVVPTESIVLGGSYSTYGGGQWVQTNGGVWTLEWNDLDLAFTTYVTPTAIP